MQTFFIQISYAIKLLYSWHAICMFAYYKTKFKRYFCIFSVGAENCLKPSKHSNGKLSNNDEYGLRAFNGQPKNLTTSNTCGLTTIKDKLPENIQRSRIDPYILDSYINNPYTQSLTSVA